MTKRPDAAEQEENDEYSRWIEELHEGEDLTWLDDVHSNVDRIDAVPLDVGWHRTRMPAVNGANHAWRILLNCPTLMSAAKAHLKLRSNGLS